ncbi:hypothetical protein KIN20_025279 [Parelaphostrongylus tenuis]|uniref:Uncharacterized protein n=1 Tax=Parelaphostrongylus tenuis TaxID=148309 RepID=A0AAD5MUY0_PARTN|nr:hypothetical protein KIN20_025279 [Parelaphostrongylus tenuis]
MVQDKQENIRVYTISERLARFSTAGQDVLTIEIPIPQPEYSDVDEYVAVFGERGLLDVIDQVELRKELVDFIREETRKFQEERDDALIKEALERGFDDLETEPTPNFVLDHHEDFANKFSFIMRNSSSSQLAELMRRQISMINEMSQIIRVRNWEVADLTNKCENAVNDAYINVDVHPHELSKLNEKLRNLHASYACQIELLVERQKRDFRNMVDVLYSGGDIIDDSTATERTTIPVASSSDAALDEVGDQGINESYTIYIGKRYTTVSMGIYWIKYWASSRKVRTSPCENMDPKHCVFNPSMLHPRTASNSGACCD